MYYALLNINLELHKSEDSKLGTELISAKELKALGLKRSKLLVLEDQSLEKLSERIKAIDYGVLNERNPDTSTTKG